MRRLLFEAVRTLLYKCVEAWNGKKAPRLFHKLKSIAIKLKWQQASHRVEGINFFSPI